MLLSFELLIEYIGIGYLYFMGCFNVKWCMLFSLFLKIIVMDFII